MQTLGKYKKHFQLVGCVISGRSSVLTRFRFTVWEVELTDGVLSTLNAEQWSCRNLKSRLEEHEIPDQSPVSDLPFMSHIKNQSSQRTPEQTWTWEYEPVCTQNSLKENTHISHL